MRTQHDFRLYGDNLRTTRRIHLPTRSCYNVVEICSFIEEAGSYTYRLSNRKMKLTNGR